MTTEKKPKPLTNAEHQARWRARRAARLAALEQVIAAHHLPVTVPVLRKEPEGRTSPVLRKTKPDPGEARDEVLTAFRQRGDQLSADYLAFVKTSGVTATEAENIEAHYLRWRQEFSKAVRDRGIRRARQQETRKKKR